MIFRFDPMPTTLPICHFNDAYRVAPQKISKSSSKSNTIDVTQFAALLDTIREQWPELGDGKRDGLVLFSGDLFSPSTESSVSRGSHMVPVMNELAPDASLAGNHDFDFGYPHLCELIRDNTFPWLLSNVIDTTTSRVPEPFHEFLILERAGIRIGIIGLADEQWITTVSSWPSNFQYKDMAEAGMDLSKRLRDPEGNYRCELIIALTHARVPKDIVLAKALSALSPSAQQEIDISSSHGVDILFGGHDHFYFVSKGVTSWENYDITKDLLGAKDDNGDVLVLKSGTDFRDLSECTLELDDTPLGSVRRKVIKGITGKRHTIQPGSKSSEKLTKLLEKLLSSVSSTLRAPVCKSTVELDVRSQHIRATESAAGNWFADVIRHAYDDTLCMKGCGGSDGVLINAGTLRGDSVYAPGNITLGDIMGILPFEDPIVVLELDGESIWAALESSLSAWPAQEGRFPVISGFRVSWDSRRLPGQRILGIWLQKEAVDSGDSAPNLVDGDEIKKEKNGRKYNILTREYLAQGHDGYVALTGSKHVMDDEVGQMFSALVRQYLLGSRYVNKMARLVDRTHLHADTNMVIRRERQWLEKRDGLNQSKVAQRWHRAAAAALHLRSQAHYKGQISVSARERMCEVDCFDGGKARKGSIGEVNQDTEDLITIYPVVDGRLKDEGNSQ